jgi:nucleoside-diphosphate-sugar epimerase
VGKVLLPMLLAEGRRISALMRNPVAGSVPKAVRVVKGDLHDVAALAELTMGADVVLHIAGVVSGVTTDDFMQANLTGTTKIAQAAIASGVKRFVHVSSLAAREPGLNAYGASKAAAERALVDVADKMTITVLRPAAIYGPGDTATLPLLQALMSRIAIIPGSPVARFGMVHVDDVARALTAAVRDANAGTFEIDDGAEAHNWPELLRISRENFGVPERVFYIPQSVALTLGIFGDGVARLRKKPSLINSGQIRQIYHADWRVKGTRWPLINPVQLKDGLPQTIRWYQAQGLLPQRKAPDKGAAKSGMTE